MMYTGGTVAVIKRIHSWKMLVYGLFATRGAETFLVGPLNSRAQPLVFPRGLRQQRLA